MTQDERKISDLLDAAMGSPEPVDGAIGGTNTQVTQDSGLDSARPVFFVQNRVFRQQTTISAQDVYKGVARVIDADHIQGIQRVGNLWRIYPDTIEDRIDLLSRGIGLKGTTVSLTDTNPFLPMFEGTKVTVHGIPLSASDTVILGALRSLGCRINSPIERQRLRVDGKLTNCQTGGRTVYLLLPGWPDSKPLPRTLAMGRYRGSIYYKDQPYTARFDAQLTCRKCLQQGHHIKDCVNDWVCSDCRMPGHKRGQCPLTSETTAANPYNEETEEESDTPEPEDSDDNDDEPEQVTSDGQPEKPEAAAAAVEAKDTRPASTKGNRKPKKAKVIRSQPAQTAGSKITRFLKDCRNKAEETQSDAETVQTPHGNRKPVTRSPRTPPEEQHDDDIKRHKAREKEDQDKDK